ncbi:HPP family protein [Vreelandella populi]|uniref:HPP family protein n=2 Tax=Vreelandella populi TaxID=2498858 RepID=A0A433L7S6_9GAMM|nr:HPP family protein [Halomonas populi]RUR43257.1 HPP family protein [Halomonas populi]
MSENMKKNEKSFGGPEWFWSPVAAALTTLLIGGVALVAGQPWLFPSLGPSIYLHMHKPNLESARLYNTVVGHATGVAAGAVGVLLTGASQDPSVLSSQTIALSRVGASAIAMGVCLFVQQLLKASHPPAAATALLIALGGFKLVPSDILAIAVGVGLIALIGEPLRRVRVGILFGGKRNQ